MAGGVKCDCRQLKRLRDNLTKLQDADMEKFCTDMSKELARKLLALVIPATPVGDYSREITVVAKRTGKSTLKARFIPNLLIPAAKRAVRYAGAGRPEHRQRPKVAQEKELMPQSLPLQWQ